MNGPIPGNNIGTNFIYILDCKTICSSKSIFLHEKSKKKSTYSVISCLKYDILKLERWDTEFIFELG
jgi:hypothetical protein